MVPRNPEGWEPTPGVSSSCWVVVFPADEEEEEEEEEEEGFWVR